jgi:hypothetical protein
VTARPSRLPRALLALTAAAVVPLAGCAGTDATESSTPPSRGSASASSSSSAPAGTSAAADGRRIEVTVSGGQASGDTGRVQVPQGEHVSLVITSDVADEVHVHGYDLEEELEPGKPTNLTFDATVPGVFEVELHETGTLLLTLQVG